ncbi:MAG: hypothetical protein R2873_30390 [Caldilineaceae bacterium]
MVTSRSQRRQLHDGAQRQADHPSISDNVLEGITRSAILQLAREQLSGLPVEERPIDRSEVYRRRSAPVRHRRADLACPPVDHRTIGDGKIGPVDTDCNASSSASSAAKRARTAPG